MAAAIRVRLVKSSIGYNQRQKDTLQALGLKRMHQTVVQEDNPAIRGMIAKVAHLVEVENVNSGSSEPQQATKPS